jgi:hypothetical protein
MYQEVQEAAVLPSRLRFFCARLFDTVSGHPGPNTSRPSRLFFSSEVRGSAVRVGVGQSLNRLRQFNVAIDESRRMRLHRLGKREAFQSNWEARETDVFLATRAFLGRYGASSCFPDTPHTIACLTIAISPEMTHSWAPGLRHSGKQVFWGTMEQEYKRA